MPQQAIEKCILHLSMLWDFSLKVNHPNHQLRQLAFPSLTTENSDLLVNGV